MSIKLNKCQSVQFSHSVVSNSLQPHGLHHTRLCCPSPSPGVCSNSCPLSQWCHLTISSSATPFSSCFQFIYLFCLSCGRQDHSLGSGDFSLVEATELNSWDIWVELPWGMWNLLTGIPCIGKQILKTLDHQGSPNTYSSLGHKSSCDHEDKACCKCKAERALLTYFP